MATEPLTLGDQLKEARLEKQWTLEELTDRTGLTGPYLSKVERSLATPSQDALVLLADKLGIGGQDLDGLLEERRVMAWSERLGVDSETTEVFVALTKLDSEARAEMALVTEALERLDGDTRHRLLDGLRGVRESLETEPTGETSEAGAEKGHRN